MANILDYKSIYWDSPFNYASKLLSEVYNC